MKAFVRVPRPSSLLPSFSPCRHASALSPLTHRNNLRYSVQRAYAASANMVSSRSVNTDDTAFVYRSKTTGELLYALAILKVSSFKFVADYAAKLLDFVSRIGLGKLAYGVVRLTFFKHFCGGETLGETLSRATKFPFQPILFYSVESSHSDDKALDNVARVLAESTLEGDKFKTPFNEFKYGGLCDHDVLLALNDVVPKVDVDAAIKLSDAELIKLLTAKCAESGRPLSPYLTHQLTELLKRVELIFKAAEKTKVRILVDAEQTYYQRTIDFLTLVFCYRYNKDSPIVYNTYQMYLKDSASRLKDHADLLERHGLWLAVKCVRGAYIVEERKLAAEKKYPSPVHDTLEGTHYSYNETGAKFLLSKVAENKKVAVLVASHNEDSANAAVEYMKAKGISLTDSRVHFAQLMGMCDHLSYALKESGVNSCKLFPFGPVEEVMPYMIRRMQENQGFMSSTFRERQLLMKEIKRRLSSTSAK